MLRLPVLLLVLAQVAFGQYTRVQRLANLVQQDPQNIQKILDLAALKLDEASGVSNETDRAAALDEVQILYLRANSLDSRNVDALYHLGVISWMKVFPAVVTARREAAMDPETPGPVRDRSSRAVLNARYRSDIDYAIATLEQAIAIEPSNNEAMAYLQMAYRARADFKDSRYEWDVDQNAAGRWREKAYEVGTAKQLAPAPALTPAQRHFNQPPSASWSVIFMPKAIWIEPEQMEKKRVNPAEASCPPGLRVAAGAPPVTLSAVIDRDGSVLYLERLDGPEDVAGAAIDAVRRWTYLPTLLNGRPVMVKTSIVVPFNRCLAE